MSEVEILWSALGAYAPYVVVPFIGTLTGAALVGLLLRSRSRHGAASRPVRRDPVRWMTGANVVVGSYEMVTLDDGLNWYSVERVGNECRITGAADPKVLATVLAWRELGDRVWDRRQLDTGSIGDRALLMAAGFEVVPTRTEPAEPVQS